MEMICIKQGAWLHSEISMGAAGTPLNFGPKYLELVDVSESPYASRGVSYVVKGYERNPQTGARTTFRKIHFVPPADISELKEILQSELKETTDQTVQ